MEAAYKEDQRAGPATLVTDDIADARPFNSLRFEGSALEIAKEMPVRNYRRCSINRVAHSRRSRAEEGAEGIGKG